MKLLLQVFLIVTLSCHILTSYIAVRISSKNNSENSFSHINQGCFWCLFQMNNIFKKEILTPYLLGVKVITNAHPQPSVQAEKTFCIHCVPEHEKQENISNYGLYNEFFFFFFFFKFIWRQVKQDSLVKILFFHHCMKANIILICR